MHVRQLVSGTYNHNDQLALVADNNVNNTRCLKLYGASTTLPTSVVKALSVQLPMRGIGARMVRPVSMD
jgi:hypothetical protein